MSGKTYRVVQYLNQFFAGEGGEEQAGARPHSIDGPVGPGRLLEESSGGALRVAATVICGDNRFVEDPQAEEELLSMIAGFRPEAFVAGPAFLAGRYGEACAELCKAVREKLAIPVITGLAPAHPAVDRYRSALRIVRTGANAADMRKSMPLMTAVLLKDLWEEELSQDEQDALFKRGLIENAVLSENAARRGVAMLLAKQRGETWQSEIPIPVFDYSPPAPPVTGQPLKVALVTDGGLMLRGNPEKMPSGRCVRYYTIDLHDRASLDPSWLEVNHFGYDTRYVAADPHRLTPYDVVRDLEKAGELTLHPRLFTLAGVATAVESAAAIGRGIAGELKEAGIQAVILTST